MTNTTSMTRRSPTKKVTFRSMDEYQQAMFPMQTKRGAAEVGPKELAAELTRKSQQLLELRLTRG